MAERAPRSPFEARLARRLDAYANVPVRRLEARVAAAAAVATTTPRPWGRFRLASPAWPLLRPVIVLTIVLALAAAALLVAGMRPPAEHAPGQLVYASSTGGLYLADADGSGARKVRDGQFGTPKWSPGGEFIAVQRYPDSGDLFLDMLRSDGSLIEELQSVGDFAWAPGDHVGEFLAVLAGGTLYVKHLETGTPTPPSAGETADLGDGGGEGIGALAWTSASTLSWVSPLWAAPHSTYTFPTARIERQEYSIRATRTADIPVDVPEPPQYRSFDDVVLSPDGTTFAMAARIYNYLLSDLVVVPVGGGTLRPIAEKVERAARLQWVSDSRAVIVETVDPGDITHLLVVPLDGRASYPLFEQSTFEQWLLVDDSPVDLESGHVLIGKATSSVVRARLEERPVMDLYLLEAGTPVPVASGVVGADVFWP